MRQNENVAFEAERLIKKLGIDSPPIDPKEIAESLDIMVEAMPANGGVSGMLIRHGNKFCIGYATRIQNEGFRRFCIAHELGHYMLAGHPDAVDDIHGSKAYFSTNDRYEREANAFASSLLMPNDMFTQEMDSLGDGMETIKTLASRFVTSLEATAIRYIEKAEIPAAVVVSLDNRVVYCFMSKSLKEFQLDWLRKGDSIPEETETKSFNEEIMKPDYVCEATNLQDWFNGPRDIPGTEEIVGLGERYGRTLTLLTFDVYADDHREDREPAIIRGF